MRKKLFSLVIGPNLTSCEVPREDVKIDIEFMDKHVRALARLNIAAGILGLIVAIAVLYFFGGKDGLLGISPSEKEAGGIPLIAMPFTGLYGFGISIFMILLAAPMVISGIGLLKFAPWARWLGIATNGLNILNVPVGTILGMYALWVLMSEEVEPLFDDKPYSRD